MKANAVLHNIFGGIMAAVMLGTLVYLYYMTEAVDLGEQNEVMGLLSEVKEIDTRWDTEAQRARIDLELSSEPLRSDGGSRALRNLTRFAQLTESMTLRSGLTELRDTLQRKSDLVEKFRDENLAGKTALQALLQGIAGLESAESPQKRTGQQLAPLLRSLDQSATQFFLRGQVEQREALQAALKQLQALPVNPEQQQSIVRSAQTLLDRVPTELALFTELQRINTGPRLIQLTLAFNSELEESLQEKERYRIYLIYYASALLVLLMYLGWKLKAANLTLEHRVEERTRDLSDALKHLKESEAQLIQSEKMSSLGQMVAGVAHEINTPLAYVKNSLGQVSEKLPAIGSALDSSSRMLELLAAGNDPDGLSRAFQQTSAQISGLRDQHVIQELADLVRDGVYGTGQVAEIVANLKNFSRLDRSKVAHTNLNDNLHSTLLLAKHQLKSVNVIRNFGELPEVTCAPSQINQVLLNLITNAVQAMPEGKGKLTLTSRQDGEGVSIDVEDNGSGIPPDVLPRIFDPFFTTKEIGKGTGLGLSISYKIVQQHGGRITVDSKPGEGTKFTVWLPLTPPPEAQLEG